MSDNRNIDQENFTKYSYLINQKYAHDHGYDIKFFYLQDKIDRHPSWQKILVSLYLLDVHHNYDYYIYIDTDCIFNLHGINISSYLSTHPVIQHNYNICFFRDVNPSYPCAGFFIFNRNARDFLQDWFYNISTDDKKWFWKHSWEQKILHQKYPRLKTEIGIIQDNFFCFRPNQQFLLHVCLTEDIKRLSIFRDYYRFYINTTGAMPPQISYINFSAKNFLLNYSIKNNYITNNTDLMDTIFFD